jgi:hypothetical protein
MALPTPKTRGETSFTTLQTIWFAMVVSVVIYLFLARYITATPGFNTKGPIGVVFGAFAIMSAALFLAQLFFRTLLSDNRLFPRFLPEEEGARQSMPADPEAEAGFLLQNHLTFSTVLWALGEAPAIFGLVLTFLSGDQRFVTGFVLYSLANLFIFRPRRGYFDDQVDRLRRYLSTRG